MIGLEPWILIANVEWTSLSQMAHQIYWAPVIWNIIRLSSLFWSLWIISSSFSEWLQHVATQPRLGAVQGCQRDQGWWRTRKLKSDKLSGSAARTNVSVSSYWDDWTVFGIVAASRFCSPTRNSEMSGTCARPFPALPKEPERQGSSFVTEPFQLKNVQYCCILGAIIEKVRRVSHLSREICDLHSAPRKE